MPMKCLVAAWLVTLGSVAALAAAPPDRRVVNAVKAGDRNAVRALVTQKVDVNTPEVDGTTALHWAVRADDRETVELLLRAGAHAQFANRYGVTPLSVAALNGSAVIIDLLLQAGADPNTTLPEGETILMRAARTGKAEALKVLLARGADVNAREGWHRQTALMWAVSENHPASVKLLIESGADVNAVSAVLDGEPRKDVIDGRTAKDGTALQALHTTFPKGGLTPLLFAARQGAVECARALIEAGADVNHADPDGITPLVLAIINGHYDVAALLIDRHANVNAADPGGRTALWAAVDMHTLEYSLNRPPPPEVDQHDSLDIVKLLLERGANPNAALRRAVRGRKVNATNHGLLGPGATPLMRAATHVDVAALKLLLAHHANPNLTTQNRTTAFMLASGLGWRDQYSDGSETDAIEFLTIGLERGADVNAANDQGNTALHGAAERGSTTVIEFLLAKGARLDARNKQGQTPLDIALGFAPVRETAAALLREQMIKHGIPITLTKVAAVEPD
jgi:ankyrin repeat protein